MFFLVDMRLAGIRPHERCFRQLMGFGGTLHDLTLGVRRNVELRHVKRHEAEPVMVQVARRRAGAGFAARLVQQQLDRAGITVNAVAPGFVRTDMTQGKRSAAEWEAIERSVSERTMMGRIGQPEDIANAVAFIAAPESGWVTAQMLVVDGGRMDYVGHG